MRTRLAEAEETLRAIRTGEVDTVLVPGKHGPHVFTLQGAEQAYRRLIESMNEGALMLGADKTILYANRSFARMVKCPLEQVTGGSLRRFLSAKHQAELRPLLRRPGKSGTKIQVRLTASDGSFVPAQISLRLLTERGSAHTTVGLIVTDMTDAQRNEELMRALTHHVVQGQETERADVALKLHDHITQLLCAILFRCQALVDELTARRGPSLTEAMRLREMLGKTAEEVERISNNLRPGVLEQLGLIAVLHASSTEFANRTGVLVKLACARITRLPARVELAIYRIFQEALKNVETHARARELDVRLTTPAGHVLLVVRDDGVGFVPPHFPSRLTGKIGVGLIGMRERAASVGGTVTVKSARRTGTEITVRIPLPAAD